MSLSSGRFQSIYNGMTSIAQKVYQAVPMSEAWSYTQVHAEMVRLNTARELNIVRGCLNTLRDSGLITEGPQNHFMRVPVREKAITTNHESDSEMTTLTIQKPAEAVRAPAQATTPTPQYNPIEKFDLLSARANTMSNNLKQLASDIETAAIEVQEFLAAQDAKSAKFRQLQALLTELS